MPLTTLPNPGMDFTPLTPLTAEEMDDIVENIEAINNATIQTASIADGAVTKAKLGADAMSNQNYSTSEIDTGTTWIDGKKIYKKTIDCGAQPTNNFTSKDIPLNIPNFEKAIKIEGIMFDDYNEAYPLPYCAQYSGNGALIYGIDIIQYSGSLEWNIQFSWGGKDTQNIYTHHISKAFVTVYYTKTS